MTTTIILFGMICILCLPQHGVAQQEPGMVGLDEDGNLVVKASFQKSVLVGNVNLTALLGEFQENRAAQIEIAGMSSNITMLNSDMERMQADDVAKESVILSLNSTLQSNLAESLLMADKVSTLEVDVTSQQAIITSLSTTIAIMSTSLAMTTTATTTTGSTAATTTRMTSMLTPTEGPITTTADEAPATTTS